MMFEQPTWAMIMRAIPRASEAVSVGVRNWLYDWLQIASELSGDSDVTDRPTHLLPWQSPYTPSIYLVYLPPLPAVTSQPKKKRQTFPDLHPYFSLFSLHLCPQQ